jgi:uncharacterized protein YlxW (UPF0749 family)
VFHISINRFIRRISGEVKALQQEHDQLKSKVITLTTRLEDVRRVLSEQEDLLHSKDAFFRFLPSDYTIHMFSLIEFRINSEI